jgi:acyl-ACP thioesterase
MILDKETSKPKNLTKLHLSLPKDEQKALSKKMKRLTSKTGYDFVERLRTPYSAIDLNEHVNNTEYVKWAIDAAKRKFPLNSDLKSVQATYVSEVFEADEIDVFVIDDSLNSTLNLLIRKSQQDIDVFLMEICY